MRGDGLQESLVLLGIQHHLLQVQPMHAPVQLIQCVIEVQPPHPWHYACLASSAEEEVHELQSPSQSFRSEEL